MSVSSTASDSPVSSRGPGFRSASVWLGLLLLVHLVLGLQTAFQKTVTHDEIWHLPVGILDARTGTFDHDVRNPPLTRLWAAVPACLAGVEVEGGHDPTDIALKFVLGREDHRTWYVWGRCLNLVFTLITAWILFRWARDWFGPRAALVSAALFCGSPNVLAHASLVTPDAGMMCAFLATLYCLNRWLEQRGWGRGLLLGGVLGLAQGVKFTAVLLYPLVIVPWLLSWLRSTGAGERSPAPGGTVRWRWLQFPVLMLWSLLVWNGTYLFQGTGQPLSEYKFRSRAMRSIAERLTPVESWPVPLPKAYLIGLDEQRAIMEGPHPTYLNGVWSLQGFPSYYVRAMEYKLPHLLQGLFLLGMGGTVFWRSRRLKLMQAALLWLPMVCLTGIASFTSMQLGIRYVLPVLPLVMLVAGSLFRSDGCTSGWRGRLVWMAVLISSGFGLRHHPHHLAYFNEWAGGPVGGRQHLLDSNLDWGQDLHLVKAFMDRSGLSSIGLVYFGTMPAEVLGIEYEISPGWTPSPGWHAVSVNYVMGRPHLLREPDGTSRPADLGEFAYFQRWEPVARLGYSIDLYHIPE